MKEDHYKVAMVVPCGLRLRTLGAILRKHNAVLVSLEEARGFDHNQDLDRVVVKTAGSPLSLLRSTEEHLKEDMRDSSAHLLSVSYYPV